MRGVGLAGTALLAVVLLALSITGCAHRVPAGSSTIDTGYWPDTDKCRGVVDGKVASVPCAALVVIY